MKNPYRMAVFAILLAAGLSTQPAGAQVRFAPQVAWGGDQDLAVGGRLLVKLSRLASSNPDTGFTSKIDFVLPFDWFVDCTECTYYEVTPGFLLPLTVKDAGVYLGAGLNIARLSIDTEGEDRSNLDLGLGLTGGLLVPIKSLNTFGEVRFTAGGAKQTVISAGILLGRGNH